MLRDNLVELIEPMLISAGADPLPLCIHNQPQASDDRLPCLENPRPAGAEPSLTENVTSPFQAEPAQEYHPKYSVFLLESWDSFPSLKHCQLLSQSEVLKRQLTSLSQSCNNEDSQQLQCLCHGLQC